MEIGQDLLDYAEGITEEIRAGAVTTKERRLGHSILRRIEKVAQEDSGWGGKRHMLLKRDPREARVHHGRAFERWNDFVEQTEAITPQAA
ncbi:hypothetical protein [Sulfitobacter sp. 1A15106]|uniref:hypothetical protein n=1 Tax=Sulfitobacter sp. 1A15106 TaxID=3368590 RepID=UPI003745A0FC